jgi:uncharacterized membrane protein
MQCPNCHRENEPANYFCIYCGGLLPIPEAEPLSEATLDPTNINSQQLLALQEDTRRLREIIALMNERLVTLERTQGVTIPSPEPTAITSGPEVSPTVSSLEAPIVQPLPPPQRKAPPVEAKAREWEQILGGNWLARIGIIAIIIGAGFFLKYAFDNNWLGPIGRVVLGIVAGLAMLWGGHYWRKRYPTFAQAFSGGGIALLYLSIFAAFAMFDLIGFYLTVGLLLLVSVVSVVLALQQNSMALAIIGIIGAFLAPFILVVSSAEASNIDQANRSFWLMVYIIVVDLGVLWLSTMRNWRWFTLLALIGSLAVFGVWYSRFGDEVSLLTSQGSLTLVFLIFVGATVLYHLVWRKPTQGFDYALMTINAIAYFGISYGILGDDLRVWFGGFSFLLALFYGGLAYLAIRRSPENTRLSLFTLGISLVFFTVAIPLQLGDKAWTTIAWAVEGTVLTWLSFSVRMPQLRVYSYVVFAVVTIRLLFFDTTINLSTFTPVLNERVLAFLVSIAAIYLSGYLLWRQRKAMWKQEESARSIYPGYFVAANFFTLWLLSAEVIDYFDTPLALTAVWAIYAGILLVVGMIKQWRWVRLSALVMFAIPIIKICVYDVFALTQLYRIIAFTGLGVILLVCAYLYQRYSRSIKGFITKK